MPVDVVVCEDDALVGERRDVLRVLGRSAPITPINSGVGMSQVLHAADE